MFVHGERIERIVRAGAQAHPDPEVEALLHFPPVVRRCVRHDGWLPERQREFIVALSPLLRNQFGGEKTD